ncbi:unnamed protein product [Cunninghamella blakesleeana]
MTKDNKYNNFINHSSKEFKTVIINKINHMDDWVRNDVGTSQSWWEDVARWLKIDELRKISFRLSQHFVRNSNFC